MRPKYDFYFFWKVGPHAMIGSFYLVFMSPVDEDFPIIGGLYRSGKTCACKRVRCLSSLQAPDSGRDGPAGQQSATCPLHPLRVALPA